MSNLNFIPPEPTTKWLNVPDKNDRDMELLAEFTFTDSKGVRWVAPKGSKINGASIPSSLWSTVGSPYTGGYRRASIVHDVACVNANNDGDRKKADLMFFDACIAGGCSKFQANTLFMGVRVGAWWSPPSSTRAMGIPTAQSRGPDSEESVKVFRDVQKKLGDRMATASLSEIDALVAASVNKSRGIGLPTRGTKKVVKKKAAVKKGSAKKEAGKKKAVKKKSVSRS